MQSEQINVEYFFRLLYELIYGTRAPLDFTSLQSFVAYLWLWVIVIGYTLSIVAFVVVIYSLVKIFDIRKREAAYFGTLLLAPETAGSMNPRWQHIQSLMEEGTASAWREAITEADIMLDDMLTRQGYVGDGVGEKLRSVEPSDFNTLNDAWEAHKVRNRIAHEGSAYDLSDTLAQRTLARYEAVFREFSAI